MVLAASREIEPPVQQSIETQAVHVFLRHHFLRPSIDSKHDGIRFSIAVTGRPCAVCGVVAAQIRFAVGASL